MGRVAQSMPGEICQKESFEYPSWNFSWTYAQTLRSNYHYFGINNNKIIIIRIIRIIIIRRM